MSKDKDKELPKFPEESILNALEKTAPHRQIQATLAKVKGKNAEATVLNELRTCYHRGEDWLLEFGLHRQTAHRWMRKAAEADGYKLPEDEPKTQEDDVPPVPPGKRKKLELLPEDNVISASDLSDLLSKRPEEEGDDNGA